MALDIVSYNVATEALEKSVNVGHKVANTDSIQDGQVMIYSASIDKFIPQYPAEGGGIARNITLLSSTVDNNVTNLQIQFKNPKDESVDLLKVKMFISYVEDLNLKTYQYMIDNNITLYKEDFITTSEATITYNFPITDSNRGQTLYVRFFTEWNFTTVSQSSGISFSRRLKDEVPNDPITLFTATQNTNKIILNWTNPTGVNNLDFAKVVVIENETQSPTNINDGVKVYEGNQNTVTLNNKDKLKHYYYRAFVFDSSGNIQDSVLQEVNIQLDSNPPLAVQNLTSTNGHQFIKLRWAETSCGTDWVKTYIVQKMGNVSSANISDGTLILTNQAKDTYKTNWFIVSGLTNSQQYTFTFFVEDINGNIGNSISITDTPTASALPTPVAFSADMNGTIQTEIKISWINPFSSDYSGRVLYHSLSDLSGKTKTQLEDMVANSQATILNQGVGTGSGANDQYINTGITSGVTNYYAMVTKYNIGGTDYYSAVVDDNATTSDIVPPANVTSLQVVGGDGTLSISYTDPSDSDFDKTIIMVTKGSFQNYNYGGADLIYTEEATKDKYKTISLTLTSANGIVNNTTYYVWVYPRDITGNKNTNVANRSSALPQPLPILSVSYEASTDTWTRGGINVGKTSEDLWSLYPYNNIKRILFDGTTVSYLKADDSTKLESGVNADLTINMYARIPKFYYKYSYATGKHTWSIAETQLSGFTLFPAFVRSVANKDYIDIGCFRGSVDGTNKLESKNGKTPNIDKAFSDYRTYAKNIGTNYNQFDALSQSVLDLLFIIQYATGNVQSVFTGIDDTVKTNGQTLSLGNRNGIVNGTLSLYGVEGVFGNGQYNVIDGLKATTTGYYLADNSFESMISESTLGTYTKVGSIVPTTTSGFIKDVEQVGSLFLGKDNTGSSSSGFGDMQYSVSESGLNVLLIGGDLSEQKGLLNNSFVNVSNLSKTLTMTNTGQIDTYTEWTTSLDKTNLNTAFKSIGSFSLVDGANPSITVNQVISAKLNGRIIHY